MQPLRVHCLHVTLVLHLRKSLLSKAFRIAPKLCVMSGSCFIVNWNSFTARHYQRLNRLEEQMTVMDYLFDESRRNQIMEWTKSLENEFHLTSEQPAGVTWVWRWSSLQAVGIMNQLEFIIDGQLFATSTRSLSYGVVVRWLKLMPLLHSPCHVRISFDCFILYLVNCSIFAHTSVAKLGVYLFVYYLNSRSYLLTLFLAWLISSYHLLSSL